MTLRRQQEVFLDGIELSIEMALIAYSGLHTSLANHSEMEAQGKPLLHTQMLLEAWSVVDFVNRARVLVQRAPNLTKTPAVVSFLKDIKEILTLQNFVQHLEKEALNVAETGYPIWGSLSWAWASSSEIEKGTIRVSIFIPGRIAISKDHRVVNPAGKKVSPPVDLISLSAAGTMVNLSRVTEAASRFKKRFESALSRAETERDVNEQAAMPIVVEVDQ